VSPFEKARHIYARIRQVNDEPIESDGLSRDRVEATFASLGLSPPPGVVELFEWHNGIDYVDAFLGLLSLDRAVGLYQAYGSGLGWRSELEWTEGLFPIVDINANVQFCIDFTSGALRAIDVEDGTVEHLADHYEHYLDALVTIFDSGKFTFDEEAGSIDFDAATWARIAKAHNVVADSPW
jgi:hypothetical protein